MNQTGDDPNRSNRDAGREHGTAIRHYDLDTLMQGDQEAVLVHNGEHYRLRITSNGKLILTK